MLKPAAALILALSAVAQADAEAPARLKIDESGRYIETEDGAPFFYLGDTAWELFHRLTYDQAIAYLDDRAAKGFTVVQAVALAELDGLRAPTPAGYLPLIDMDPARPAVVDGPNNDYWDNVDAVIDAANERGLVVGLLPSWGDKWLLYWGPGPVVFTPANARAYGEWIGRRYKDKSVIWILGGDRNPETAEHFAIAEAMVEGIRAGAGDHQLMTFHPMGGQGSSDYFPTSSWIDFHFRQNGHFTDYKHFEGTARDYALTPPKPVIDGESLYEDHPLKFGPENPGYATALEVRRALYWNLFNGAAGHAYGHHSVWQMHDTQHPGVNGPLLTWREALSAPGAGQMHHAKDLLLSRPGWALRTPAHDLVLPGPSAPAYAATGIQKFVGVLAPDRSWAMIYAPLSRPFDADLPRLGAARVRAAWFNPRTGAAEQIGVFDGAAAQRFVPPNRGEYQDWVLVLDDASKRYPRPGRTR